MEKKVISALLVLVMLIGMVPLSVFASETVASGTCGENLTWKLDAEGTLVISGTGAMNDFSPTDPRRIAPWRNESTPVVTIIIEDGVTSIGQCAFPYCKLKGLFIPKSLTSVGMHVFYSTERPDIYYAGTAEEWIAIENHPSGDRIHYSYTGEGNHWTQKHVSATCTTAGYTSETCLCGHERNVQETQNALGHDLGHWEITKEATIFGRGERICYCQRKGCDYPKAELIPAETAVYPNDPPTSVDTVAEKVDWIAGKCRETGLTDPWEIALWLHDWLIYNANYDYTYSNHGADGVLLKGSGVCDSYTKAYGLLLSKFGIENRRVTGNVTTSDIGHAWNLVRIDGEWFHVDCTWDDPAEGGVEYHGYFGLTDEMMRLDHIWSASSYPDCDSMINFYPIRLGYPVFETREEMMALITEEVVKHKDEFYLYYIGLDAAFPFDDVIQEWDQIYGWKYGTQGIISRNWLGTEIYLRVLEYVEPREKPEDFDDNHTHYYYTQKTVEPTCTTPGATVDVCICGYEQVLSEMPAQGHRWQDANCMSPKTCQVCGAQEGGIGTHIYTNASDTSCNICGAVLQVELDRPTVNMFRMYNPNTGEHFYTGSEEERDDLIEAGWQYEGVGFTFPLTTGAPVHRLFEPATGEHLYTMDEAEKNALLAAGWNYEGVAFNSAYDTEAVQHRLHNPNEVVGAYHFTFSEEEKQNLINAGWEYQGIGWYSCWK